MATVYSLVCFGGKDGKSITCSNSGGYLLGTATRSGVRDGLKVYVSGTLPGNIASTSTPYYLRGETINTFTFYDTQAHAIAGGTTGKVAWSSAGSSVKITSGYWYELPAGSGTTGRARYGLSGSERCYDSQLAARNARYSAAVATDVEVIEFATQFFDHQTSLISLNIPAAEVRLTPTVDEEPTDAAHGGVIAQCTHNGSSIWLPNGYICDQQTYYLYGTIELSGTRHTIEGISFSTDQTNTYAISAPATGLYNTVKRCVLFAYGAAATLRIGLYHRQDTLDFVNNLIYGFTGTSSMGLQVYGYDSGNGSTVANNTVVNCATGFGSANTGTSPKGWFRNNISLGNTTNWGTSGTGSMHGVGYNAGLSGEAWGATGRVTMATTDFANFANYDFRPAAITSPQVDTGVVIIGMTAEDLAQDERPNYVGSTSGTTVTAGAFITGNSYTIVSVGSTSFTSIGASANTVGVTFKATGAGSGTGTALCNEAYDIGCYEFDRGYTRPQTRNLVIPTLVSGSQVQIFTTGTTTALTGSTENSGTSLTQDMAADMTVDVTIMKVGYHPIRIAGIVLDSETYTLTVDQEIDRTYAASSGLTYTTNATIDRASKEVAINADTTVQNFRNFCIEQWIDKGASGEALANLDFPFSVNGPNSVTFENGWVWEDWGGGGTGSASIARLSRDGMRYLNTSGNVVKAWCAVYTPDTTAGLQVKIEQVNGGSIVSADNTGPVDQLVQIISDPNGDGSYGDGYNYTGHLQMRVQSVGYTKPLADVYATFGTLEDQLYSIGLAPALNYATTNSDPGGMTFNNGTKAAALTASRSVLQLYQGAQWWTNQDAQWDADVPLAANTSGTTFTLYTGWTLSGMNYITGTQTIAGGTITLAGPATYTPTFSANTAVVAQGEGTYVLNASATNITFAPTANGVTYVMGDCVFGGTINFHNTHATRAITIEVPSGTSSTTSTAGGTVTVTAPQVYQSVTITGAVAGSRIQIYDTTSSTELYNGTPTFPYTWTDGTPAAATRAIRLRVAKQSTTTAKLFIDANIGTCATSGAGKDVSYLVSQEDDDTYNTNAIDGSGVTDITIAVSGGDRVKIAKAGGSVTWASIYAYQVYWQFTATGIAQETAFIEAPDTANYLLTDFDVKNTHATVPLTITGGWGRDAVTGLSKDIIDTTGTNIYMAPDHVIPYSTGSGLTAGQAAELTAAASSSATAASAAADAETAASAAETAATLARKLLSNKRVIDTATGTETLYDDNGTALYTRLVYEDAAGSTAYDGTAAPHRVEKYT